MAKSKESSNKRAKEKQRQKAQREKKEKMEERRANQAKGKPLDEMLAYVDENGNITSTPPDPEKRRPVNAEEIDIGVPKRKESDNPLKEGQIDYFDGSRGFGFILQTDGAKVFFHIDQAAYPVREGDWVNYTVERSPKGWNAVNVTKKP